MNSSFQMVKHFLKSQSVPGRRKSLLFRPSSNTCSSDSSWGFWLACLTLSQLVVEVFVCLNQAQTRLQLQILLVCLVSIFSLRAPSPHCESNDQEFLAKRKAHLVLIQLLNSTNVIFLSWHCANFIQSVTLALIQVYLVCCFKYIRRELLELL